MAVNLAEMLSLPVDEKLKIVEAVWDSIAADESQVPLSEWHKEELQRRLDSYEKDGQKGRPAAEVFADIKSKL